MKVILVNLLEGTPMADQGETETGYSLWAQCPSMATNMIQTTKGLSKVGQPMIFNGVWIDQQTTELYVLPDDELQYLENIPEQGLIELQQFDRLSLDHANALHGSC